MEKLESEIVSFLSGDDTLSQVSTTFISNLSSEKADILVDGFDDEQIFQQIEFLYTSPILEGADEFDKLEIESDEEEDENEIDKDQEEEENAGHESEEDQEDEDVEYEVPQKLVKNFDKTEVDDEFFSLRQMEQFCDEEDEKEMNEEDEDELDQEMEDELYGEEEEEDEDGEDHEELMHDDFFQSRFEKRSAKVAEELEALEDEAMEEKAFHLMGETTAQGRAKDQLLAMDLDFQSNAPPVAPTVQMTEDLENIIIQRIRDKAYDDVERKSREMVEPAEAKRRLVPDEERKSLSQLYEDEFLQNGKDLDEDKDRKQIKEDMNRLFAQLDFLTYDTVVNQKEVEIKVTSDAPALTSEEKGPSLLSTYSSLAPEEVAGKSKGQFMSKEERSATDIKRDRRRVKAKIKARKAAGKEVMFKKAKRKDADLRPVDSANKVKWTNSAKVFKTLQDEVDHGTLTALAKKKAKRAKVAEERKAKSFKL